METNSALNKNLDSIEKDKTFKQVFICACKVLYLNNNNYLFVIAGGILLLPLIWIMVLGPETLRFTIELVDMFLTITIALFGIFFTGYAIFQAFFGSKLIVFMIECNGRKESIFKENNLYFFVLCILYLVNILADIFLKLYLNNYTSILPYFSFFNNANNILKIIFIETVVLVHLFVFIETKSLVYNIYSSFNAKAMLEGVEEMILRQNNDKAGKYSSDLNKYVDLYNKGIISDEDLRLLISNLPQ
jgi:hypothetical protein